MNLSELLERRERIYRMRKVSLSASGEGFSQTYETMSGDTQLINVRGVKSPEEIQDVVHSLFVWLWSIKDGLRRLCVVSGIEEKRIEQFVNSGPSLAIVADVANQGKHFELDQTRSGRNAELGSVRVEIPLSAMRSISFSETSSDIGLDVALPEQTEIVALIEFGNGDPPADAIAIIDQAIEAWEKRGFPIAGI